MKKYVITARITVSSYTVVEAESDAEALEIAKERTVADIMLTGGHTESDSWITEELDGTPFDFDVESEE